MQLNTVIVQIDFPSLNPYHAEFLNVTTHLTFLVLSITNGESEKGLSVYK